MVKLSWIATILAAVLGGLLFVAGVASATGAPQEAAAAGMALCVTVILYVFARALTELRQ